MKRSQGFTKKIEQLENICKTIDHIDMIIAVCLVYEDYLLSNLNSESASLRGDYRLIVNQVLLLEIYVGLLMANPFHISAKNVL